MTKFSLPTTIASDIFRAYDIRGIVDETLTADVVYAIGRAFGSEAQARGQQRLVVGRDGRLSGEGLMTALIAGLVESGCDVINIVEVPTPVLYFATEYFKTHSGVMLTGSHNPPNYNGLKMMLAGVTLAEEDIQQLYQRIVEKNFSTGSGKIISHSIIEDYLERIVNDVQLARPLKIVVDCGNGIAGAVAPALFSLLGCEVIDLFCEVDGNFPNHHPDPSQPDNLQDLIDAVLKHNADVGLAFDGDGDRLGVIDSEGQIIWPDRQMMLYAQDILSRNQNAQIIFDVKCSRNLANIITESGGQPILWKTGHSLIKRKMRETKALLAGEMSGHIFFKERWYGFDDALYTGARLLEIITARKESSANIFRTLPNSLSTPELKLPVSEEKKFFLMDQFIKQAQFPDAKINTIDGLRADFSDGWGLVRPSNTSPYLVLRFEAENEKSLQRIQSLFREQLIALDNSFELPF